MTGRQLLRRPGYELDIPRVLAACARYGVAVEINANPWRLDLDWRWHQTAVSLGCTMSINPDAHSAREIDLTHWGVEMARKGWVSKDKVLNCQPVPQFGAYLQKRWEEWPWSAKRLQQQRRALATAWPARMRLYSTPYALTNVTTSTLDLRLFHRICRSPAKRNVHLA